MTRSPLLADPIFDGPWLDDPQHRDWLMGDARQQLGFFDASLRRDGGFDVLDHHGTALPRTAQELHTTTRMVHSFALGQAIGHPGADKMIDAGMQFLWDHHRDPEYGGYFWSTTDHRVQDGTKLAYGHVFVLLAAASAKIAGHPDADRLLGDVSDVLLTRFWDHDANLLRDEFTREWQPFSTYRGMNANMHGVEAMLAAYEATGDQDWMVRAGRVLEFFTDRMARGNGWRLPEHYTEDWQVDPTYAGNPMFRPAGTTPGHSLELGRLTIQHWDLAGRPDGDALARARSLIEQALVDAWLPDGGLAYTLDHSGQIDIADRYWWPVTEAIGAMAALIKAEGKPEDEAWYRRLWQFADGALVDHARGGWFPELNAAGRPVAHQFAGKPDIYHALQAALLPLTPGLSRQLESLSDEMPKEVELIPR